MAKRESQGLQAALILFVIITIALSVTTYYFYRESEEQRKAALAAKTEVRQLENGISTAVDKLTVFKYVLGIGGVTQTDYEKAQESLPDDAEVTQLVQQFDADMTTFGVGLPPEQLNYTSLPSNIITKVRDLTDTVENSLQNVRELTRQKEEIAKREAAAVQLAVQTHQKQATVYDAELLKVKQLRDAAEKKQEEYAATIAAKSQQITKVDAESKRMIAEVEKQRDKEVQLKEAFQQQIKETQKESFEVADGQLTWVNQRSGTVWINLGSADGLRRQITFSVFDRDESAVTKANAKGTIEVIRIMEDHLAEAKIVESDSKNLFLPGDQIFSTAWQPGRRLHYALAGYMDIDGDRKDDREKVKSLILLNGGVVDSELLDDGKIEGKMNANTRYFVVGDRPTDASSDAARTGYARMLGEAQAYGVEQVSVEKFLTYMGYRGSEPTVPLGSAIGSDPAGGKFTPRRAPERGKSGAF